MAPLYHFSTCIHPSVISVRLLSAGENCEKKVYSKYSNICKIGQCNYLVTVDLVVTIYLVIAASFGALRHLAWHQSVISIRGWCDVIVCATTAWFRRCETLRLLHWLNRRPKQVAFISINMNEGNLQYLITTGLTDAWTIRADTIYKPLDFTKTAYL